MNSVCGIINLDKAPVRNDNISKMLDALKLSGKDSTKYFQKECIAFGNVEHYRDNQTFPVNYSGIETFGNITVIGISRIFNKKELFRQLNLPEDQGTIISDNLLFLKCFEKWEYTCPDHIQGEWVFVMWNDEKKELFIANSHYGKPNLYYYKTSNTFYFSSSLKALLALDQIPKKLNEFRLGQMLIGWNNNLGNTIYENIFPLKPAHTLRVSSTVFEESRYWALEDTLPIRFKTDMEYVENFKGIYTEAVKDRIAAGENTGATLSGGLDSGSVTALAAMSLQRENKILQAFSSIPLFDVSDFPAEKVFADETEYIQATANHVGNIELDFIKSEGLSPLQAIKKYNTLFEEPNGNAMNLYWLLSVMQRVQSKNIDTLLIGQSGNITVSWKGQFQGFIDWRAFIKDIHKKGITNVSCLQSSVKNYLLKPFIPSVIAKKRSRKNNVQQDWNKWSPINNDFAGKQDFIRRMQEAGHYDYSKNPRTNQLRMIKPLYGGTSAFWAEMGRLHNVWITDPTADKRVLEFCTSIPNNQFYRKGIDKYLFKRAMKGIMPEKVIYNTQRGKQAADLQQRIVKNDLLEIKSILETLKKSEHCNYYLDFKKIESTIPLIEKNDLFAHKQIASVLLRGIAFGLFLLRFE